MQTISKTMIINNRTVSIQGTPDYFDEATDALLTFEVNGHLFEHIRFQDRNDGDGYRIGHQAEVGEEALYRGLFTALTGNESAPEEDWNRYDWALSQLPGWKQVDEFATKCINTFA